MPLLLCFLSGSALAENLAAFLNSFLSLASHSSESQNGLSGLPSPQHLRSAQSVRLPHQLLPSGHHSLSPELLPSLIHSPHWNWNDFYKKASLILSLRWLKLFGSSP